MKTPLLVPTALALVAATSFSPATAQAPKPLGPRIRNTRGARHL